MTFSSDSRGCQGNPMACAYEQHRIVFTSSFSCSLLYDTALSGFQNKWCCINTNVKRSESQILRLILMYYLTKHLRMFCYLFIIASHKCIRSIGTGVKDSCESPDHVGAGNQTRVLHNSNSALND